jgi:hypothetical protein
MGFFKSIGKIARSITKPLKKVVKSPLGRTALMAGLGYWGAPKMFPQAFGGPGLTSSQGWKHFLTNKAPWLYEAGTEGSKVISPFHGDYVAPKAASGVLPAIGKFAKSPAGVATLVGGTALAAAPKLEEEIDIDVDSAKGDTDYRALAEYYEPEWTQWLIDQGYSAEDASRMANQRLFSSKGGRIGFRVGGGKGMSETEDTGMPVGGSGANYGPPQTGDHHPPAMRDEGILSKTRSNLIKSRAERELMNRMGLANRGNLWGILGKKSPDLWARQTGNPHLDYTEEDINRITQIQDYFNQGQGNFNITQDQYSDIFPTDKPPIDTGGGGEGQPYIWPPRNVGAVSSAVTENPAGDGDYYGFKEWADWEGQPTTPMFGGDKYRGVLASKGGRIGLYIGGMGAMNQGMNPMTMNQGIGAMNPMGSVRSQMMGRPMMGQDPRMAQMNQRQNINTGIQQVARPPKESEDTELLQLLTSMGIPMEQLRGRTKDELVEMAVALKGKTQGGRDVTETAEVIEEEDIREQNQAAGGGLMRSRYAIGSSQFGMGTEHPIIPDKDGPQLDMRDSGGYQPHGKAEKHDDVRALLAQGEFVMTSDAVKGMGGGDRELGAKKMYDLMHSMEAMA